MINPLLKRHSNECNEIVHKILSKIIAANMKETQKFIRKNNNRRHSQLTMTQHIRKISENVELGDCKEIKTPNKKNSRIRSPISHLTSTEFQNLQYPNISKVNVKSKILQEKDIFSDLLGKVIVDIVKLKDIFNKQDENRLQGSRSFEIDIWNIIKILKNKFKSDLSINISLDDFSELVKKVENSTSRSSIYFNKNVVSLVEIIFPVLSFEVQSSIINNHLKKDTSYKEKYKNEIFEFLRIMPKSYIREFAYKIK